MTLTNIAEITDAKDPDGNPVTDIDSTPGDRVPGQDDQDGEVITIGKKPCVDITVIVSKGDSICAGVTTRISATSLGNKINLYLTPIGGTPFTTINSGEFYTVRATTTTIYYAEAISPDGKCKSERIPIIIVVNARPETPTCIGNVTNTCPVETVDLTKITISPISLSGSVFEWHTGASPTSPLVTDPTKVGAGKYYLFERSEFGCYSNPMVVTVTIQSCECANVPTIDAGRDQAICSGDTIFLRATIGGSATAATWTTTGTGRFGNATSPSTFYVPSVVDIISGSVTITATTNDPDGNGKCRPAADALFVTISQRPVAPEGVTADDSLVCKGGSTRLVAFAPGFRINWYTQAKGGTSVGTTLSGGKFTVLPTASTTYYAEAVGENGCVSKTRTPVKVTVKDCADLNLKKYVSNNAPAVGEEVTYTIAVKNDGPSTATNVEVADALPAGLEYVSSTNMTYVSATNTVVGNVASIANGATFEFKFKAKIKSESTIRNFAQITKSDQSDPDSRPNNGTDKGEDDDDDEIVNPGCPTIAPPVLACATSNICIGQSSLITAIGCEGGVITWSNGSTGASITVTPSITTVYTAVCKKGSCTSVLSNPITIIVNTPTTPIITSSEVSVCGSKPVTLTATNCAGTIMWSTGATGAQIIVTPTATATYTATCKIGICASTPASITINVSTGPPAPEIICSTEKVCAGEPVTLQIKGCAGVAEWSTGETGPAIVVTPTVTTTYTAICNVNGCKSPVSIGYTITVTPIAAPLVSSSVPAICPGASATLTATGCDGTITWSNGATGASIVVSPSVSTSYTATCKKGVCVSGNSNLVTLNVTTPTAPVISANKQVICSGESVTLTASGCLGSVVWSNGTTGVSITVMPMASTSYTATCQIGACTSPASSPTRVTVNSAGTAPTLTASKPSICTSESVTLTATGCAGTVTWSTGATGNSISVTPSITTTYTATCATAATCPSPAGSVSVTVGTPNAPTVSATPSTICAGQTATLTATGCLGTVTWSNGATGASISVSPTTTTSYTATCGSAACLSPASSAAVVTVNAAGTAPTLTASKASICTSESVTLNATGCAGTVTWSTGATGNSISVTPSITTTYTATCATGSTCISPAGSVSVTVGTPNAPTVSAAPSTICAGQTATLTATGCAGTVTWSNGATGASISVSPTTTTSYTATCGSAACLSPASSATVVTVNAAGTAPTLTASKASICTSESVTLTATGCAGTVTWSTGATGNSISVTPSITTTYTATCATGSTCISPAGSVSVTVGTPNAPTVSAAPSTICAGQTATLTATGCAGTVTWSNGATGASISVSPTTTTSYTATCGSAACLSPASSATVVTVNAAGTAPTLTASKASICTSESVTLTATGCAGTVTWSTGATGNSISVTPSTTTTYTAICTTATTCAGGTGSVTVTVGGTLTAPTVSAAPSTICAGQTTTLTATGCTGTITWSNGATGASISVSPTNTTSYTATCGSGVCLSPASNPATVVTVNAAGTTPTLTASKVSICTSEAVTLTATGCAGTVTWSTGATGNSISVTPSATTTYTAICTTATTCAGGTGSVTVTVGGTVAPPTVTCTKNQLCPGESETLIASGCAGIVNWSNGATGNVIVVSPTVTTNYSATCTVGSCTSASSLVYNIAVLTPTAPVVSVNKPAICSGETATLTAVCDGTVTWSNGVSGASIVVSPLATTSYTAICKVGACTSARSASVTVTVNTTSSPTISASAPTVCAGQSVTLTAANCTGSVVWSNGATGVSTIVTPIAATTYTAVCRTGACTSSVSNAVTVTITNVTAPTIVCSSTTVCPGDAVTLTAQGCSGEVVWNTGATGATITIIPLATTSYSAICKLGACVSPSSTVCEIKVGRPATPSITASATSVCLGESVTLTASGCPAGSVVTWSNNQVGASIIVTPFTTATYTAQCCTNVNCKSLVSNAITVTIATKVLNPIVQDLTNTCPFNRVDLNNAVKNATSGLTIEFRTTASSNSPLVATANSVGAGTYFVFFKNAAGCYSVGVPVNVVITNCNDVLPCSTNPATANAGSDASICSTTEFKLNGSFGGAASSIRWTTDGTGTFSNSLDPKATYFPTLADITRGSVRLTLTTNDPDGSGPCVAASASIVLTIKSLKISPVITVNGEAKQGETFTISVCNGDSVVLAASETTGYDYKWSNGATTRQIVVRQGGSYSYKLTAKDGERCASINSTVVTVNVNTNIPMPAVTNLRNVCNAIVVNLTQGLIGAIPSGYSLEFRSGRTTNSPLVASPTSVGAGTYYAFYRVTGGSCYGQPSAILVTIVNCDGVDSKLSDVSVTKVASKRNVVLNENVTYKIVVKNNGKDVATNVDVRDILPAGLEVVSSTGFTKNGNTLTIRIAQINVRDSVVLSVVAKATVLGLLRNTADITYLDQVDINLLNNTSSAEIVVTTSGEPVTGDRPLIAACVKVKSVSLKQDGSYDVSYKITVDNAGNVPLTNVQLIDSLSTALVLPITFSITGRPIVGSNSTLRPNPSYNGKTDLNLLVAANSTLAVGKRDTICINLNVRPNGYVGVLAGNIIAIGQNGSTVVRDVSNDGATMARESDTKTGVRFDLPATLIGLSKKVGTPVKNADGSFSIPYTIGVTNLGFNPLTKVQVVDNLSATFGNKATIVGNPTVTAEAGLVVNTNYTGQGLLTNLLVDTLSSLPRNTTRNIQLVVKVRPTALVDSTTIFNNIAIGTAFSGSVMTKDTSASGDDYDPNKNLDPRDDNRPTGISLNSVSPGTGKSYIGSALSIKDTLRNGDGSFNITYRVLVKNFGTVGFTNVQLKNTLSAYFNDSTGASYKVIGTPIASDSSQLRINPDFNGASDTNLLIAEQSKLAVGSIDSVFYTVQVTTDGRLTPYQNQICARALAGRDTLVDFSTNGLDTDPNGDKDPTELSESDPTVIVISSESGIFVPEGFSPNGDGVNDLFVIRHPVGTNVVLEIFDRWQHKVYQSEDYQNDWDGKANVGLAFGGSQGLPVGTYFYNAIITNANGDVVKRECRFMTINR